MQNMLGTSIRLYNETLFMKAVIRNLTFDGIDSPLLHMADEAGSGMLGDMLANQVPFDRFGWFYDVRPFLVFLPAKFKVVICREIILRPMTAPIRCILAWTTSTKLVKSASGKGGTTSATSTPRAAKIWWAAQESSSPRTGTRLH